MVSSDRHAGAGRQRGDLVRNAAHHQALDVAEASAAHNDHVGTDFARPIQNGERGVAVPSIAVGGLALAFFTIAAPLISRKIRHLDTTIGGIGIGEADEGSQPFPFLTPADEKPPKGWN